jgi:GT2 family glycosyltransferase
LAEAGDIHCCGNEYTTSEGARRGAWFAEDRVGQACAAYFLQAILGRIQLLGIYLGFERCDLCNGFAFAPLDSGIGIEASPLERTLVSTIIVNWRSTGYLRACLYSIYKNVNDISFETIVVDNGSFDGCGELIEKEFPGVIFIQNEHNSGFSRANNLAVRRASGEYLLFLNPDTEIVESAFGELTNHLERFPQVGIVGCRVLNSDLTIQQYYLHAFPSLLNRTLNVDLLKRTFPKWRLWGIRALCEYAGEAVTVDAISGCCMLVRKTAFEKVGGFGESFFMYTEDVDLSLKIKNAGFGVQYIGKGEVIHHGRKSSALQEQTSFADIMVIQSTALFFRMTRGAFYAQAYRMLIGCSALVRLMTVVLLGLLGGVIFQRRWVSATWRKWTLILRWAIHSEEWSGLSIDQ